jgi:hypothetical protein
LASTTSAIAMLLCWMHVTDCSADCMMELNSVAIRWVRRENLPSALFKRNKNRRHYLRIYLRIFAWNKTWGERWRYLVISPVIMNFRNTRTYICEVTRIRSLGGLFSKPADIGKSSEIVRHQTLIDVPCNKHDFTVPLQSTAYQNVWLDRFNA